MNDRSVIIGLLIGLIVILVVAGVSLLVRNKSLAEEYKKEMAKSISSQQAADELSNAQAALKKDNENLRGDLGRLNARVEEADKNYKSMEMLKQKLEEDLKDEMMKNEELLKQQRDAVNSTANSTHSMLKK